MKTKTTTLLLSLVLSFGFFVQQSEAASPSDLPTVPSYCNPAFSDITTPPPASGNDSQNGMNLNFIPADVYPSEDPNPIKVTKKDALERTLQKISLQFL